MDKDILKKEFDPDVHICPHSVMMKLLLLRNAVFTNKKYNHWPSAVYVFPRKYLLKIAV